MALSAIAMPASRPRMPGREQLQTEMKVIAGELEAEAKLREGSRTTVEKRWIEDLEQYHGIYDENTIQRIRQNEGSELFINMTGPKTEAMAARLMDLLFPTDDKNWGIGPTPVPELTKAADEAAAQKEQMLAQVKQMTEAQQQGGQPPVSGAVDQLKARAEEFEKIERQLRAQKQEADNRARLMEKEVEDQLKESDYHGVMRDVIDSACKIGAGVCKGPVTGMPTRQGWRKGEDGQFNLVKNDGKRPGIRYVDPWGYFPDMASPNQADGMGDFERHLMNKKQLRALARLPGFDRQAIARLLQAGPTGSPPSYLAQLRSIRGENVSVKSEFYQVWEYSGPLDVEQMEKLALAFTPEGEEPPEIDPLVDIKGIVWFCAGEVLKFAIYPYDSQECMYSIFTLKKDEYSPFGYGIPSIMRDMQRSMNAGWRAMMDNASIASGPQIVVDSEKISPQDGDYQLRPRKIWEVKVPWTQANPPFWSFDIPMMQVEMANIVAMSERMIDEVTSMPKIAQGEQGTGVTKTSGGMSLLMNSANVTFRRIVRNFDDDVTVPNLRRFYDWNMQHNPRDEIKGDYKVDARGSSVLLAREIQAQNLFQIALQLGPHPVFGPMLQNRMLLRKLLQAQMLSSDDLMLTDDEIDAIVAAGQSDAAAEAAKAQAEMAQAEFELREKELDVRVAEANAKIDIANKENETKIKIAELMHEKEMEKAAATANIKLDELASREKVEDRRIGSKERLTAAEVALTQRLGPTGGGIA